MFGVDALKQPLVESSIKSNWRGSEWVVVVFVISGDGY
jgi:hypothetical protein